MQKAIKVKIQNITLNVEEKSAEILENYLKKIRTHFASYADGEEIIADLETRIAEKALKLLDNKEDILGKKELEKLIKEVGEIDQIEDKSETDNQSFVENLKYKLTNFKLLRDTNNQQIAGVCAGLGVYFKLDPVIFRIVFGLVFLLGILFSHQIAFFIVALYIILWVAMPAAKSSVERIEMKGEPVTLANIKKESEILENLKTKELGTLARIANSMQSAVSSLFQFSKKLLMISLRFAGVFLIAGTVLTGFSFTIGVFTLLINPNVTSLGFTMPIPDIQFDNDFRSIILVVLFSAIPMMILSAQMGFSLLAWKNKFKTIPTVALIAISMVATGLLIAVGISKHENYVRLIESNPENYVVVSEIYEAHNVKSLSLQGNYKIKFVESNSDKIKVSANKFLLEQLEGKIFNGTFSLAKRPNSFYIPSLSLGEISVELPKKDFVFINIYGDTVLSSDFKLNVKDFNIISYGSAEISLELDAEEVNITAYGVSNINLAGTVEDQEYYITGSSEVNALNMISKRTKVMMYGDSSAIVYAEDKLTSTVYGGAKLTYYGNPELWTGSQHGGDGVVVRGK